jgi:hypothetical protein
LESSSTTERRISKLGFVAFILADANGAREIVCTNRVEKQPTRETVFR